MLARIPEGPLRLLGVQISNLSDVRAPVQSGLFGMNDREHPELADPRHERTTEALDKLRRKFGRGTVVPASLLQRSKARREREGE